MRPRVAAMAVVLLAGWAASGCGGLPGGASGSFPVPATTTGSAAPAGAPIAPAGPVEAATVVRVVDGDTIVVDRGTGRGRERLRYIGIDTPESVAPDRPVEYLGPEAARANAALVDGREVVLERDVSDTDGYGRLLRYVWLRQDGGDWQLVNLELVRRGFAQVVTYPPDVRWTDVLLEAQRQARNEEAGLWGSLPSP